MSTVQRSRHSRTKKATSPRSSRIEALEARRVLAAPTLPDFPDEVSINAGAPIHVALGGQDADGDDLTYTVTSTNSNISATIPKQATPEGNRSMRITVQGYGEMVFELFEGRAPNTTARIIEIVESGWYENREFHRIIDGFMIQAGSRDGLGINGTGTEFDDEYHPDLQFTSSGLLAMAKSGDDTNDSQFFITDVPSGTFSLPRWLDFNHTIFGRLTAGDDVRNAISEVATDSANRPTGSDILIESVEIFYDNQNAVMMVSPMDGIEESGDITITVSDGKGGTASETVTINVLPDTQNNNPFLGPIDPIRLTVDQPYSFQLDATDIEGDKIYYSAELLTETDDLTVSVTEDGLVTITPMNEVVGVAEVVFRVGPTAASLVPDSLGEFQEGVIDSQFVTVAIPPLQPVIGFAPGSDTGAKDGSTARDNSDGKEFYFEVENLQATSQLTVYLNGVETPYEQVTRIPQGDGSTNYVATIRVLTGAELDDGDYTVRIQQFLPLGSDYGNQNLASDLSEPFEFSVDTAPPVITSEAIDIAIQGEEYFYDVDADDEGDDDVYYRIQMPVPDGMVIDYKTGEISWTPTSDVGYEQPIVIQVIDGAGNEGRQSFSITVYAPLEFTIEGDQTVDESETVTLMLTASNPADLSSALTITLQDGVLPADADYSLEQLEGNQARFIWNTTEADGPGVYDLVFGATNNVNAMSQETVRVSVSEVNQAPELTQVFDEWQGTEDDRIDLQFLATDADLPANELVFDVFGDVPEGVEIDATGLLSWTPGEEDGGKSFEFGVRVTDSGNLSDEHMIVISVAEVHTPPVFDAILPQQVIEGDLLDFLVVAHDPDVPTHEIQYQLEEDVPEGMEIDAQTGRLRWQVPENYLPDSTLSTTLEVTVVAREIVTESEVPQETSQTVEITVVDSLAELIAATLTQAESAVAIPLAGPATVSYASTTSNDIAETLTALQIAEVFDNDGFFGTQFGPTGAGGAEAVEQSEDEDEDETDPDAPNEDEQTSTLDRLLDEIADEDMGDDVIEAMLANRASTEDVPPEADAESESEHVPVERQAATEQDQPDTDSPAESDSKTEVAAKEVAAAKSARS